MQHCCVRTQHLKVSLKLKNEGRPHTGPTSDSSAENTTFEASEEDLEGGARKPSVTWVHKPLDTSSLRVEDTPLGLLGLYIALILLAIVGILVAVSLRTGDPSTAALIPVDRGVVTKGRIDVGVDPTDTGL